MHIHILISEYDQRHNMDKLRCTKLISLIIILAVFLISAGFTYWTYAHSTDQSLFPFQLTLTIMFFLMLLNVALDFSTKIQHVYALQMIANLALIIVTIINLTLSAKENFNIIFNSIVISLASIDFSLQLFRASLARIREKVDFVPTRPIIKP